jgi:hypothetical protein
MAVPENYSHVENPLGIGFSRGGLPMSAFSDEQRKELEGCVNTANQLTTRSANVYTSRTVADAILAERERLARIVETCAPITDLAADPPSRDQNEIPDLTAMLRALGRAIRTGRHG